MAKTKPNMAQARAASEPPSAPVQTGSPSGAPPGGNVSGGSPAEEAVNHLQQVVTLWKSNPQEVGPILGEFVRIVDGMRGQAGSPAAPTGAQPAPPQPPGPPAPGAAPTLAATRGAMA